MKVPHSLKDALKNKTTPKESLKSKANPEIGAKLKKSVGAGTKSVKKDNGSEQKKDYRANRPNYAMVL
jgi:hypothetical protein